MADEKNKLPQWNREASTEKQIFDLIETLLKEQSDLIQTDETTKYISAKALAQQYHVTFGYPIKPFTIFSICRFGLDMETSHMSSGLYVALNDASLRFARRKFGDVDIASAPGKNTGVGNEEQFNRGDRHASE